MTEEIIKECKNCDALGIDSEIGVYYCCLSHRQDDLPKEFTCNDFTPNKQLKRLEQENKELKEIINKSARSFCNDYLKTFEENKFLNNQIMEVKFNAQQEIEFLTEENNTYRSALEEIREHSKELLNNADNFEIVTNCANKIVNKIEEVSNKKY